ncbi:bZIP transcription factor [Legionella donaldsonii]|uniref:BZIP transcription factor n=1 Tax=Legionella donaldsonii TaxID=45060 RepID=A0A378J845_9GAMM|nr:bZIP transcription factor [Legionella donaldsonii]STX43912.1 bZIP transcription factor [Legionella donaldsonii]
MLEFYQTQQATQHFLTMFLDLHPHDFPSKDDLIALTSLQSSLLEFLIGALKNPSSTPEISMKVWEDYSRNYREQQRLLAPVVSAEYAELYLPELVLPAAQIKEEEEEVLAQGSIGFQVNEPLFINNSFFKFETDSSSQQPSITSANDRVMRSNPHRRLVGPYAFFPLPEKTDKTSREGEKYALYEQQVENLKERKGSLSVEEKQELRRLSNLLSARKSRVRKKDHLHELEIEIVEIKKENEALEATCQALSSEQQMLKRELAQLMSMVAQAGIDPENWLQQVMVSPVKNEEESYYTPFQPD